MYVFGILHLIILLFHKCKYNHKDLNGPRGIFHAHPFFYYYDDDVSLLAEIVSTYFSRNV